LGVELVGTFITFEGGEGTGKTTQIGLLADHFRKSGQIVLSTREPGGTSEGNVIRNLLVSGEIDRWNSNSEMLLNFAARDIHLRKVIRPALERGEVVLCDRFIDSTAVYQCYAGDADRDLFQSLTQIIVGETLPDFTIVLDVDPKLGVERSKKRMSDLKSVSKELYQSNASTGDFHILQEAFEIEGQSNEDRFERMNLNFHEKVREGFQIIANQYSKRCILVDSSLGIEAVASRIRKDFYELVRT
jgi:dTMP kinase